MLKLTQLVGFASGGGGGTDATPNAIDFNDISDAGITASAFTNVVTISGIDTTITVRLTVTSAMSGQRPVYVYRDGGWVSTTTSGTTVDVTMTNNQTLQYGFANSQNSTTWSGTATVTNESDAGAVLDSFTYTLTDTGSGGGVAVMTL